MEKGSSSQATIFFLTYLVEVVFRFGDVVSILNASLYTTSSRFHHHVHTYTFQYPLNPLLSLPSTTYPTSNSHPILTPFISSFFMLLTPEFQTNSFLHTCPTCHPHHSSPASPFPLFLMCMQPSRDSSKTQHLGKTHF